MTTRPSNIVRSLGFCALVAGLCLWAATGRSNPVVTLSSTGSQVFFADGPMTADGGDILTATTFSIGALQSSPFGDGYFDFSNTVGSLAMNTPVTVNINTGTSLTFFCPQFGTFSSTSIVQEGITATSRSFTAVGSFTGGTAGGPTNPDPAYAEFGFSFSQDGGPNTDISFNGTLSLKAQPVPEPSTMALGMLGLAGLTMVTRRRRPRRLPAGLDAQVGTVQEDAPVVVDA